MPSCGGQEQFIIIIVVIVIVMVVVADEERWLWRRQWVAVFANWWPHSGGVLVVAKAMSVRPDISLLTTLCFIFIPTLKKVIKNWLCGNISALA